MSAERFCDCCDIDMELHPFPWSPEPGCEAARRKAELVERFFSIVTAGDPAPSTGSPT